MYDQVAIGKVNFRVKFFAGYARFTPRVMRIDPIYICLCTFSVAVII